MTHLDLLQGLWALSPDALIGVERAFASTIGAPLVLVDLPRTEALGYTVRDGGVAVLTIEGLVLPKPSPFAALFGAVAASEIAAVVRAIGADSRAKSALLDVDSPGGAVLGISGLAAQVRALASMKPVVTLCSGQLCSAAYWFAAAANAVYISGGTDRLGSLGVALAHRHDPKQSAGVTEVTAGKFKRIDTPHAPLSLAGRAALQARADHVYSVILQDVATHRRTTPAEVHQRMADGRIFIGQQALDAGLADGVSSVDDLAELMATNPKQFAARRSAASAKVSMPVGAPISTGGNRSTRLQSAPMPASPALFGRTHERAHACTVPPGTASSKLNPLYAAIQLAQAEAKRIGELQREHIARGMKLNLADAARILARRTVPPHITTS